MAIKSLTLMLIFLIKGSIIQANEWRFSMKFANTVFIMIISSTSSFLAQFSALCAEAMDSYYRSNVKPVEKSDKQNPNFAPNTLIGKKHPIGFHVN